MKVVGLSIASIPFGFAVLRAATTGTDFRYFWLASASTLGAACILVVANRARPQAPGVVVRVAFALLGATGSAAVTGFALGARSIPALIVVALGFATCSALGLALALLPGAASGDGRPSAG
jgi:hypothetical protein